MIAAALTSQERDREGSGGTPVILALGSNLGDRRANLARGLEVLRRGVTIEATSRLVESEPWGPVPDQPHFLNLVVRGRTALDPHELLDLLRRAEAEAGRVRDVPQGPRTLDVDIVFFGDREVRSTDLRIPHPRWRERPFVSRLVPDVAGAMIDPGSGRPLADAAEAADLPPGLTEVAPLEMDDGGENGG